LSDNEDDSAAHTTDGPEKAEELFQKLLERTPKGFSASSMGKFDDFRKWLAEALDLGNYATKTYAVGSAGIAHNFSARWAQNNNISGSHVPLGLAFLSIPDGVDEDELVATATNTSSKFVDGSKPTSFEAIITFVQPSGEEHLKAHSILALPGSKVAQGLLQLFPDLPVQTIEWKREQLPPGADAVLPTNEAPPAQPLGPGVTASLTASLEAANYQAGHGLVDRVVSSLAAKPFLILAGLSGSGKTLLGIMVSHWLAFTPEQVAVVAVGADWTSKHHLLGYPDALDGSSFVRTPALELLLRAAADPTMPYFLVLDEMNLSHVERYFSDFLSAMESAQPIHLHGDEEARAGVPSSLPFPKNVFVLGTINVDETTYMFSPKVLDRANVIEFTVSRASMRSYLEGGARFDSAGVLGSGAAFGTAIVDFAASQPALAEAGAENVQAIIDALDELFAALDTAGLQFGYRTAREMVRYHLASRSLAGKDWKLVRDIDVQIAQRIIPRLSGDVARLRPILIALLAFCESCAAKMPPQAADVASGAASLRQEYLDAIRIRCDTLSTTFPIAADKISRMLTRLHEHGFTTAIEA
jgi:hypothetical protein